MSIIKKYNLFLLREMTEFNLQRFGAESGGLGVGQVDNPALSLDGFDKHQSGIRQAMSRIDDILYNLKGTSAYSTLRSKLALEDQDIQSVKIQRIVKSNSVHYDVYLTIVIDDEEYWGTILNITGLDPKFESEVFKDFDLYQPKEWIIKIKGLVIKTIKTWLKPDPGTYTLINDEVIFYSVDTGKQLRMEKGIEIELVRSHDDKIIVRHDGDSYNLIGDNFIYFNYWFEPIED
jgi:hypothetical protein